MVGRSLGTAGFSHVWITDIWCLDPVYSPILPTGVCCACAYGVCSSNECGLCLCLCRLLGLGRTVLLTDVGCASMWSVLAFWRRAGGWSGGRSWAVGWVLRGQDPVGDHCAGASWRKVSHILVCDMFLKVVHTSHPISACICTFFSLMMVVNTLMRCRISLVLACTYLKALRFSPGLKIII